MNGKLMLFVAVVFVAATYGSGRAHDLRGNSYLFFRSQHTSARNFFDRRTEKAFNQQVYPDLTLGGPIAKNKRRGA